MKIAILSDSHFDTNSRWEETLRIHRWFVDDIKKREVDLVLHAGDFGPLVPIRQFKPEERLAVSRFLRTITDHCAFYAVRGNHDVFQDLTIFNELETKHPLHIMETPEVLVATANNGQEVAIAGMPWPNRAELLQHLGDASREKVEDAALNAFNSIFLSLGVRLRALDMPSVFLMHAMVRASRVSTGQPLCGQDFEVGQENIGLVDADFSALGHVHLGVGNEWTWNGKPIAYCGSARRTNHGETEEKSYILLEFDEDRKMTWQRIPIPCTPMLLLEAGFTLDDGMVWLENESLPSGVRPTSIANGADIRLRYECSSADREPAKVAAKAAEQQLREMGAVEVKVEERVIPVSHARAPQITEALTVKDQLETLWTVQGSMPSADEKVRLLAKLTMIEYEGAQA